MSPSSHLYRYCVDAADQIVWVDELWLAFARENGAPALTHEFVLGRPLWDFVSGYVTRQLYSEIHTRVRSHHQAVVLPFRCDSPTLKRHMRLTITAAEAGRLIYESALLRVEPQRSLGLLDPERPRSDRFLTICSCCKKGLLESTGWLDLEDVSTRLQLFALPTVPQLLYTTCPDCAHVMRNSVGHDAGR